MRVRDVMTRDLTTVGPHTPFKDVVDLLVEHRIGGLPVVDDDGVLLGIVTETDLITKAAYEDKRRGAISVVGAVLAGRDHTWLKKAAGLEAEKVMTRRVVTTGPDEDLHVAARRLLEHRVGQLPVVEDGRLVGIVARSDLLRPFQRSDDAIAVDVDGVIQKSLFSEHDHSVGFSVSKGVVALSGRVTFPRDVEALLALVGALPGVVSVHSEVTAHRPDPGPPPSRSTSFDPQVWPRPF